MSELVVSASKWSLVSDSTVISGVWSDLAPVLLMTFTVLSQSQRWLAGSSIGLGRDFSKYLH